MSFSFAKPVWVLSHDSQKQLAQEVVKECQRFHAQMVKEKKAVPRNVEYKDILKWKKFNDGYPNLFIDNVKEMAGKDVIFVASFHSVDLIFEQIGMIYQIPRYLAHSFTVILPYFPTGTMERIDFEGQVATAKTLASMLSIIPPTARGPTQIMIFDIHVLQERFYFSNDVIPRLDSAIPLVIQAIKQSYDPKTVAIAFPDDGARKRFNRLFPDEWPRVVCAKTREGEKREVRIKEGHPDGKHVIIIDDLVQSGGTLLEAGKALKIADATSVSAFVTHAVFPNESWRQFMADEESGRESIFTNFWITDSLPHSAVIAQYRPFKLLSLSTVIAQCLLGFDLQQHC